jgi:hypothetical protein
MVIQHIPLHKFLRTRLSGHARACACRGVSAMQGSQGICDTGPSGDGGILGKAWGGSRAKILAVREACLGVLVPASRAGLPDACGRPPLSSTCPGTTMVSQAPPAGEPRMTRTPLPLHRRFLPQTHGLEDVAILTDHDLQRMYELAYGLHPSLSAVVFCPQLS